jgi:hypothetical protein
MATASMSMNKAIHGAVRRDLDRFVGALTTFRDGDAERARQLETAWVNFHDQLDHHHRGEHEIAWPALQRIGVDRALLEEMDAEHEAMAAALDRAGAAMAALQSRPGAGEASAALAALQALRQATVEHLDHEEQALEEVYLSKQDDPAMKEMGRQFAKVSPARGGRFFAWVSDGATEEERAVLTGNVPAPVLALIGGVFGRGYRKNVAPVWRA